MTVMTNVVLVLKDSEGNIGIVKPLTDNDIIKIANAITDVGQVVDPATHMPIEATTASVGVVQLATAQDITNGTAGKVVDAQELNNFAQTLPAANGITDVSSGDNSNQIVVSKLGDSKTLTIDNVEHADNADEAAHATQADTATSANSVAWNNVSGKPSSYTPSSHTHDDRYYTESEIDTKLSGKSDTTHNHNSAYLGITAKAESAKSADSVAWNNVSGKPSTYTPSSHTHDDRYYTESEIDTKLSSKIDRIDGGYKAIAGNGEYDWCKLATITILSSYINNPISFEIDGRGILRSIVQILFENVNNSDPSLASFISDVSTAFYIKKVATSKWELYGHYSEPWGSFFLYRVSCNTNGIAIDTTPSNLSSAPSGTTKVSANSVAWSNVSGRPDIWIG